MSASQSNEASTCKHTCNPLAFTSSNARERRRAHLAHRRNCCMVSASHPASHPAATCMQPVGVGAIVPDCLLTRKQALAIHCVSERCPSRGEQQRETRMGSSCQATMCDRVEEPASRTGNRDGFMCLPEIIMGVGALGGIGWWTLLRTCRAQYAA